MGHGRRRRGLRVLSPRQRQERPDNRSTSVRESESYNPTGVRLGGFRFFGSLEADEVFNDNIYATSNATGRPDNDALTTASSGAQYRRILSQSE